MNYARWSRLPALGAFGLFVVIAALYVAGGLAAKSLLGAIAMGLILLLFAASATISTVAMTRDGNVISLRRPDGAVTVQRDKVVAVLSNFMNVHVYHLEGGEVRLNSAATFLWQIVGRKQLEEIFDQQVSVVKLSYFGWPSRQINRAISRASQAASRDSIS